MESPLTLQLLRIPDLSSPPLPFLITSLDTDQFFRDVSRSDQIEEPKFGLDPVQQYFNDLASEDATELQEIALDSYQDIAKDLNEILEADTSAHIFYDISQDYNACKGPAPRSSDDAGSNFEKTEAESWINDVLTVASQPGECFVSSPSHTSQISFDMSEDIPQLHFWLDSSVQTNGIQDIFSANNSLAYSASVLEQGSPFFYDSDTFQGLFQNNGGTAESIVPSVFPENCVAVAEKVSSLPINCGNLHWVMYNTAGMQQIENEKGEDLSGISVTGAQIPIDCPPEVTISLPMETPPEIKQPATETMDPPGSTGAYMQTTVPSPSPVLQASQKAKTHRNRGKRQKSKTGMRMSLRRRGEPTMVDLRALLVDCARAVAADDVKRANDLLHEIWLHSSPFGNGMERLAHYFAESLVARLSGTGGRLWTAMSSNNGSVSAAKSILKAYHLFVAVCPFWKLSHFFANQAILNAAEGATRLHIVDFNIMYGFQWPCLIKALSEREGGPPLLRITGIDIPRAGSEPEERVEETGRRLEEYARMYGVPFEYQAVASRWEEVKPGALQLRQDEVLVVNCIYRLRHLMDETMVGAASPRKLVLSKIRCMNPKLFVEGVVNAGYNAPFFLSRFREALFHYSSVFDALDTTIRRDLEERIVIEREIMGREILNVVACEGMERRERPETYRQWQWKTERAGFEMLPLDPCIKFKAEALVKGFYHKDYGVEEDSGRWLLLGWKGRILHGISTWRPALNCPTTP